MTSLKHRLTRLEQFVGELLPDQERCPGCRGRKLIAFSDEPDNTGPSGPYDSIEGTCRWCWMPPPGTHVMQLPAPIASYFATLPWSDSPRHRYIEKALLLKALIEKDIQEAERIIKTLHERDANGMRHWRWPASDGQADSAIPRIKNAETDIAT